MTIAHRVNVCLQARTFQGVGDIVPGGTHYWSLRAYNAASVGNAPLARIRRQSDGQVRDFSSVAGGYIDTSAILAFNNNDNFNLNIVTLYDQCSGLHLSAPTPANEPPFGIYQYIFPFFNLSGNTVWFLQSAIPMKQDEPLSISWVANRTPASGRVDLLFDNNAFELGYDPVVNTCFVNNGNGDQTVPMSDNNQHAISMVIPDSGAGTATGWVDGVSSSFTAGSAGINGSLLMFQGGNWTGFFQGLGIWPFAFNSTQAQNLNTNQHLAWSF